MTKDYSNENLFGYSVEVFQKFLLQDFERLDSILCGKHQDLLRLRGVYVEKKIVVRIPDALFRTIQEQLP